MVSEFCRVQSLSPSDRATVLSEMLPGASASLHARPSSQPSLRWEPDEFRVEIQTRLLAPVYAADSWCPFCDQILDSMGHHARQCAGSCDRNRRHDAVRNEIGEFASRAGKNPELEKAELLPPDLDSENQNQRRPADVYLPSWHGGRPAALDIAITSPQRADALQSASQRLGAAAERYEERKRGHLDTAQLCALNGFSFIPIVFETSGGLGPSAACTLKALARSVYTEGGNSANAFNVELEALSAAIRRANARAVLRRRSAEPTRRSDVTSALSILRS